MARGSRRDHRRSRVERLGPAPQGRRRAAGGLPPAGQRRSGEARRLGRQLCHDEYSRARAPCRAAESGAGLPTRVSRCDLQVPVGAFFQGNRYLVPALLARVAGLLAGADRVVDLYGGVGFLAAAARHAGAAEITLVEASRPAAAAARLNLPGARVVAATAESYLRHKAVRVPDAVIVDPPRRGLSGEARAALLRLAPARIVMLACDPASFGRDAGALLDAGYSLDLVELYDLFAGSHHVETLASFRRGAA